MDKYWYMENYQVEIEDMNRIDALFHYLPMV